MPKKPAAARRGAVDPRRVLAEWKSLSVDTFDHQLDGVVRGLRNGQASAKTRPAMQSAQQIISMQYNINRNVSIVAVRDQFGVLGIDVKIRQRKK